MISVVVFVVHLVEPFFPWEKGLEKRGIVGPLPTLSHGEKAARELNPHNVVTAIDVNRLACDSGCQRTAKEQRRVPDLAWLDIALQGRAFRVMLQHIAEP
jgi:hypothetical protein